MTGPLPFTYYISTSSTTTPISAYTWGTNATLTLTNITGGGLFVNQYNNVIATVDPVAFDPAFQQEQEERFRVARETRESADERAKDLRASLLNDRQNDDLFLYGYFDVESSSGRRWRIWDYGQAGNCDLLNDEGVAEATYCIHPRDWVPDADAHVAQMLTLMTNEEEFMRVGNRSSPSHRRFRTPVGQPARTEFAMAG